MADFYSDDYRFYHKSFHRISPKFSIKMLQMSTSSHFSYGIRDLHHIFQHIGCITVVIVYNFSITFTTPKHNFSITFAAQKHNFSNFGKRVWHFSIIRKVPNWHFSKNAWCQNCTLSRIIIQYTNFMQFHIQIFPRYLFRVCILYIFERLHNHDLTDHD